MMLMFSFLSLNANSNTCTGSRTGSRVGTPKDQEGRKTPSESRRKSLFDVMNEEDRKARRSRDSDSEDSVERERGKKGRSVDRKSPFAGRKSPYIERGNKGDLDDDLDKRKEQKKSIHRQEESISGVVLTIKLIQMKKEGVKVDLQQTEWEGEPHTKMKKNPIGRVHQVERGMKVLKICDEKALSAGTGTKPRITVEEKVHLTENETRAQRVGKVILVEKETKAWMIEGVKVHSVEEGRKVRTTAEEGVRTVDTGMKLRKRGGQKVLSAKEGPKARTIEERVLLAEEMKAARTKGRILSVEEGMRVQKIPGEAPMEEKKITEKEEEL